MGASDMENEIKAICTKCGGNLVPDQEGKIYRCMFCGVAFGSSILFDKDAEIKAYKASMADEFNEADVWYRCILMRDPGNAKALRGRVLCAGKWKNLLDIDTNSVMSNVRFENINERIDDAIEHTDDDKTKEYFQSFKRLVELLAKIQKVDTKLKPIDGRIKNLRAKRKEAEVKDRPERENEIITHYSEEAIDYSIGKENRERTTIAKSRDRFCKEYETVWSALKDLENELKLSVRPVS